MVTYNHSNLGEVNKYAFLSATVTSVDTDNDTVDISGDDVSGSAVPLFYHCLDDSEEQENGSIEGAASAFSEDDEVIVMCEKNDAYYVPVRVVGFTDGPKECYNEFLVINCHDYYLVWDCRGNREASITDPVSGNAISFPASAGEMANWLAASSAVSTDECYTWIPSTAYTEVGTVRTSVDEFCGEQIVWDTTTVVDTYTTVRGSCSYDGGTLYYLNDERTSTDDKIFGFNGGSFILELNNDLVDSALSCFRTEKLSGYTYDRVPSGACDSYGGVIYNCYWGQDIYYDIDVGPEYLWVTPIGDMERTESEGRNYTRRRRNTNPSATYPCGLTYYNDSEREISLDNFWTEKTAKFSEKTMFQIYINQYTVTERTREFVGWAIPTPSWTSWHNVYARREQVLAVCQFSSDITSVDPRDQESDDTLSDAINDLMDHAATNVPFSDSEVISSFSASLRTTFV